MNVNPDGVAATVLERYNVFKETEFPRLKTLQKKGMKSRSMVRDKPRLG
jgi:hypothetical protein